MGATSLGITAEDQGTEAAKQLWGPVRANQATISRKMVKSHIIMLAKQGKEFRQVF